jgi:O-acetylhomoserine (thiol)-lyase
VPIYQTTAYEFKSAKHASDLFGLRDMGNIYTRLTNPTTKILEERLCALENGSTCVATSSGQSANLYAILNIAKTGDNIIVSNKIYGGTTTLFTVTLKQFGIETKIFDIDDLETINDLVDEHSKAIFFESLSNPQIVVADIESITSIAQKHDLLTICDNTIATPYLCNPIDFGVDIVTHSCSKYVSGQGLALGGAVIDRHGLTNWFRSQNGRKRYNHFSSISPVSSTVNI